MTAARTKRWLPWVILAANLAVFAAGVGLSISYDVQNWRGEYLWSGGFLGLALAGAVIAWKRPHNPVGWVLATAPLFEQLATTLETYADIAMVLRPGALPFATLVNVVHAAVWVPSFLGILVLAMLLFPNGTMLSTRWRWIAGIAILGGTVNVVAWTVGYWPVRHIPVATVDDPMKILEPIFLRSVMPAAFPLMLVGVLGALASLIVRFRRSRGDERAQLKWMTFTVSLTVTYIIIGTVVDRLLPADSTLNVVGEVVGLSVIPMIATALAISVLKYRLYDIDVVISRTVVFGGLAAFITAIYVGIVVGIGGLVGAGDEPNLALSIVATGIVAVAFQPVRERLTRLANRLVFGHRATPYEVLSSFAGDLAQAANPQHTLERMAKLVADGTGADRVFVWLRVGETMRPTAVWPEAFLLEPIPERDLGDPAVFADFDHIEEVIHDGELLGVITLSEPRGEVLNHTEHELLNNLAGQVALLLRNLRLTEELRARIVDLHASRRRLVQAQDDERRRLERDLHDGSQQQLANLARAARKANENAEREGATQAASLLAQIADEGEEAIRTVQELAQGIYPPLLAADGLSEALDARTARAAVPVTIEADGLGRYDREIEAAVYFCVLEAVNNAAKYADASQVTVRLSQTEGHLEFEVTDDGVGFDPDATLRGHGLTNMADRLDALEGHLDITGRLGAGTSVRGTVLASRHEEAHR